MPIVVIGIVQKELDRARGKDRVGECDFHGRGAEREGQRPRGTTGESSGNYKKAGAAEYWTRLLRCAAQYRRRLGL